jgi:hypothetical protein
MYVNRKWRSTCTFPKKFTYVISCCI